jgi:hypothetical protein
MMKSEYCGLKCCIDRLNMKNNSTGSNIAWNPLQNPIRGGILPHDLTKTSPEN